MLNGLNLFKCWIFKILVTEKNNPTSFAISIITQRCGTHFCSGIQRQSFMAAGGWVFLSCPGWDAGACCQLQGILLSTGLGQLLLPALSGCSLPQVWSLEQPAWHCRIDEGSAGLVASCWSPDGRHILNTTEFHVSVEAGLLPTVSDVAVCPLPPKITQSP